MNPTDPLFQSVQAITEGLRVSVSDPADQIRLLSSLVSFTATALPGTSPISTAIQSVTAASAAMCRRAVLCSLAVACASYLPTCSTDVLSILQSVTPLYDAEIMYAADAGDMNTYQAMRGLRAAVVTDLQVRGANLPTLITVTVHTSQPALVLAYQLYNDATRAAQLLRMNPAVLHPLFYPTSFSALSS